MSIVNPSSLRILEDLLDDFLPYAKEQYGYEQTPTIRFAKDPDNAKNPLGKTGYYEPDHSRITIYIDGRHPKDIMRSISHELVHHAQNGRGDLAGTQGVGEQGYAQNNEHLREMEREAYERGNLCFRDWEDGIKSENPNMYESLKRNLKESRFAATASEEAQKINSQAGIHLNTDQAYWEKVGVRTGEELAIEILTGTYSDMFKSIHNVRPRRSFASVEEVEAAIDRLDGEMEAAVEQQKLDAQAEEEYRKNQELIASLMPNEYDVQYDKLPKQSGMGRAAMQEHKEELNMFDRRDVKLNQRLMESFGYKLKEEAYVGEGEIPVSSGQVASVGFKRGYYFWRHTNGLMNSYDNEGKFFMSLRDAGLGMSEANELLLQINDQQRQKAGGIQSGHDMSDEERRAMYDDESLSDYSGVMQEGSMVEYGKIDAEDGNPPSKIGQGIPEYMEAYNAVLVARGEEPLPIVQPDQAYLDALQSGNLSNDFSKRSVSEARPDFMGSDEEEQMMSKMSASDHYKYVTQDRGKREMSPDEVNAIESFNNWLNDKEADDYHMRQMTWEPAQSYRGGRVLAYNKKEGTWLDVMSDMPVSDEEMSDILPEAKLQAALKAKLTEVFAKHPQLASNKDFINTIKEGVKNKIMENKDMKKLNKDFGTKLAEGVVNNLKESGFDNLFDDPMDPTLDDDYEEEYGLGSSSEDEDIEALLRQYGLDKGAASDEDAPADIQRQMDDEFGGVEDEEEEEIPARRPTVMKEDDGEYAHIGIKTTQDEYGALHILPGVQFTGDIAADVKQCQQNDELDSWLYGELGSDENITDVAGKIVYAGADVQDHVGAEEDYDGSYQPRMAESNDEDGDGDVDSDDYMAKKDKAIKKASGEEDDEKKEESFDRFHSNKRNTRLNETLMNWAIK